MSADYTELDSAIVAQIATGESWDIAALAAALAASLAQGNEVISVRDRCLALQRSGAIALTPGKGWTVA